MRNIKALAATERVEALTGIYQNPEITAMAAIYEILTELPDESARLRVMRWSFGRFSEEFKRPRPDSRFQTGQAPAVRTASQSPAPDVDAGRHGGGVDFSAEIAELEDLFDHP